MYVNFVNRCMICFFKSKVKNNYLKNITVFIFRLKIGEEDACVFARAFLKVFLNSCMRTNYFRDNSNFNFLRHYYV